MFPFAKSPLTRATLNFHAGQARENRNSPDGSPRAGTMRGTFGDVATPDPYHMYTKACILNEISVRCLTGGND